MYEPIIAEIQLELSEGQVIPYLGPAVLSLAGEQLAVPGGPDALVAKLTANSSVPFKLRKNLTGAAQFIENFKHRKTITTSMTAAFKAETAPTDLHEFLATLPRLPMVVHTWYDDLVQKAFGRRTDWGVVQGVSQAEHYGNWIHYFRADGSRVEDAGAIEPISAEVMAWKTMVYEPLGSVSPAANYLVSDSDFVEVLTEIDIQTPIPKRVQQLRTGRHFLFLGCRFNTQMDRLFARQIMKRSSAKHWAVLPDKLTKNEVRFLKEQNIACIPMSLSDAVQALRGAPAETHAALAV